jgi:RNA polymerase-associated protein CTR9
MPYWEEEEYEYRDEPEAEDDYANLSRDNDGDNTDKAPDHLLAAAGLEDSDADDDMVSFFFFWVKQLYPSFSSICL